MNSYLSVQDDELMPAHNKPIISTMQRVSEYTIHAVSDDAGALQALSETIGDRRVALVTDEIVDKIHAKRIEASLAANDVRIHKTVIPPGEQSKSLPTAIRLLDWLADVDIRRRDVLLAIGGGVVIDTVGWAASVYMRGIPYINAPTTLVGQVDAAVGGKVGVDHDVAKNLIGGFYAPRAVVSCASWLTTLGPRQIRSGLAEVIKLAVICSPELFDFIEERLPQLLALDVPSLQKLVHAASAIKCVLVERDPYETDLRRTLNFGHTVGHALETVTGYGPVLHGEAVGYGMAVAVRVAAARGVLDPEVARRITGLLLTASLPVTPEAVPALFAADDVIAALAKIRQVRDGSLRFVLPAAIGTCLIADEVSDDEIREALGFLPAPTTKGK